MASKNINILMSLQDRFSSPMKNITNLTKEQEKQLKRSQNALVRFGKDGAKALGSLAKYAGGALAGAITALSGYSIKVGADFEAAMSKVQAISGASGTALDALTAKAKEMGATTQFSASEAAQAMQYMAMAGWKDTDMLNGIKGIMDLAAASGEDLANVSDIVTDALTAFGMSAQDSGRFADVLAAASSNANTNVGLMGYTFKYVAPLAGSLKYSVEDVALAIGLMANAGIKGEQAGTALRSTFTRLIKPPKEAADAMSKLGISVKNADGSVKPLNTTLADLRKAFSKLSDSEKAEYASMMAGQEAMSGFLALVNASDGDFDKLSKAIRESDGAAAGMAKTMNSNLKGQMKQFQSVTEAIGISIYDKFKKPLTNAFADVNGSLGDLNKSITDGELASSFDRLGESVGVLVKALADGLIVALPVVVSLFTWLVDNGDIVIGILSGIGAAMAVFKIAGVITAVTTALGSATTAMAVFNAVMLANPIGLVAAAIGLLVAGIVILWKNWDKVTASVKKAWETMKGAYQAFQKWRDKPLFGGGSEPPHNALGTSYFSGGRTYVNEGNRGELINLPSGSQIVPHDLAKQAVNKQPNITINLSVAGNVIGNEDFYSECGNAISTRLIAALGNV
ncbi:phage tail tape measure protein [Phascolarctobacterium succinatutens]|uniref:phage tail tape measure protein n=1 Tax=Phascolarctobacterium succinatutens TaxID=626940 RepID=UPI0030788A12